MEIEKKYTKDEGNVAENGNCTILVTVILQFSGNVRV